MSRPIPNKPLPLTPAIIADLAPGEERADAHCPGLRVRCLAGGAKVFFYRYRTRDRVLREIKLGEFGALKLAKARDAVALKRLEREQGKDPQLDKRKETEEAKQARNAERESAYTVEDLVEDYVAEVLVKQKRGKEAERLLRVDFLPVFPGRPATSLTRRELVEKLIGSKMLKHPRTATQLLSRIRCAYAHAAEQERLPEEFNSPTVGIRSASQKRRKRVLTDAELAKFLKWLPHSSYSRTVRESMQLVLLTGCRSGEIVAGRWRDIDLERGIWTQRNPKNDEPCDVMLSRQAVQLLKYRRGMDETFVFPSPHKKGKHVQQKALGLAQYTARQPGEKRPAEDPIEVAWTVHDLRRTVGTGLAKLGCPRVIQDRVLNHVDNTVSAIYDRYGYDSEARSWLQKWADYLDALTVSKVVPLSTVKAA